MNKKFLALGLISIASLVVSNIISSNILENYQTAKEETWSGYTEIKAINHDANKLMSYYSVKVENGKTFLPENMILTNKANQIVDAVIVMDLPNGEINALNINQQGEGKFAKPLSLPDGDYVFVLSAPKVSQSNLNFNQKDLGLDVNYIWQKHNLHYIPGNNNGLIFQGVKLISKNTFNNEFDEYQKANTTLNSIKQFGITALNLTHLKNAYKNNITNQSNDDNGINYNKVSVPNLTDKISTIRDKKEIANVEKSETTKFKL